MRGIGAEETMGEERWKVDMDVGTCAYVLTAWPAPTIVFKAGPLCHPMHVIFTSCAHLGTRDKGPSASGGWGKMGME